jgi:hypothetical protein
MTELVWTQAMVANDLRWLPPLLGGSTDAASASRSRSSSFERRLRPRTKADLDGSVVPRPKGER